MRIFVGLAVLASLPAIVFGQGACVVPSSGGLALEVIGTTATQAIINYTAPSSSACTIQLSQSSSLTPLAVDVDPTIFSGSNLDLSRTNTVVSGLNRTVTLGARTSQLETAGTFSGVFHASRPLQANSQYYAQVTCGSSSGTVNFATTNIPLGQTFGDPYLTSPSEPGVQPWPEYFGDSYTNSHIDPLTGIYEHLVSLHGSDYVAYDEAGGQPVKFFTAYNQGQNPCDSAGPWSNPCGTEVIGGVGATTVGNSASPLVIRVPMSGTNWEISSLGSALVLDQIGANITGSVSVAPHPVAVCLGQNGGASCATPAQTITLTTSSSEQHAGGYDSSVYGTTPWLIEANPKFMLQDTASNSGTDTVATNVVTWTGGSNNWSLNWVQGGNGRIRLSTANTNDACTAGPSSAEYTILAFVPAANGLSGNNITVSPTPPALSNFWCENNFVLMIWRPDTPITDGSVVTITNATLNVLESYYPGYPNNGTSTPAFDTLYQGGYFSGFGHLSWINPTTGQSTWYDLPYTDTPSITNPWGANANVCLGGETPNIDNTQPAFNCFWNSGVSGSGPTIIQLQFAPTTATSQPPPYKNGTQIGNAHHASSTDYSQTWNNGMVYTNLTPQSLVWVASQPYILGQKVSDLSGHVQQVTVAGTAGSGTPSWNDSGGTTIDGGVTWKDEGVGSTCMTILCQMATFYPYTPNYDKTKFPACSEYGTGNGVTLLECGNGGDSLAWTIALGIGDANPAHAGLSVGPHIVGAVSSFNSPPTPSTGIYASMVGHSLHAITEDANGYFSLNGHAAPLINTTSTSIPASSSGTPCSSFHGLTGSAECIQLQMVSYTAPSPCVTGCTGYEPHLQTVSLAFTGAPGELRTTQIGDTASVGANTFNTGGSEMMQLMCKSAGCLGVDLTQWVFQRAVYSGVEKAVSPTPITLFWIAPSLSPQFGSVQGGKTVITVHWNPLHGCPGNTPDPYGLCFAQDTNETYNHGVWRGTGGSVTTTNYIPWNVFPSGFDAYPTGYQTIPLSTPASFNLPSSNQVPGAVAGVFSSSYSPPFGCSSYVGGILGPLPGCTWGQPWTNAGGTHPAAAGDNAPAGEIIRAFDEAQIQGGQGLPSFAWVAGQLYVNTPSSANIIDPDNFHGVNDNVAPINRKMMATGAACGRHPLRDISGPSGSPLIPTDSTGSYTYGVVRVAGEVYSGSTVGQIYVNCPGVIVKACGGSALHGSTPGAYGNDICVGNLGIAANAVRQFTLDQNDQAGAYSRTLVTDTSTVRLNYGFENVRLLPDNSWMIFPTSFTQLNRPDIWLAQMVPWPGTDAYNRGTFIPATITINAPGGTDNAIVQFGYGDFGTPSAFNCTTRNDPCWSNSVTIPTTQQPFYFASEAPAGQPCASSCTITVPGISQRVMYYQVLYRNSSNTVLSMSPIGATAIP